MTLRERLRVLDDIGFIGTQKNLSATRKKALDRHINRFLREQANLEKEAEENRRKKAKQKKVR